MVNKKRYSHIDLLEGIAIFFVITYHSTLYGYDITVDSSALYYVRYFLRTILSTCVPLFFFVNGYLLFNREFNLKKHIFKMMRLIILVFIWAFLLMPLYLLIAGETLSAKIIIMSISELDTKWSMNFFWYIGALICIYLLFPALKALFDSNRKGLWFFTISIAVLTFGVVLVNQFLAFTDAMFHHGISSICHPIINMFNPFIGAYGYSFVYFCIGGLIYTYEERIRSISKFKRIVIPLIGMVISCFLLFLIGVFFSRFYDDKMWDVVWDGYDSIFTFTNVLCIYVLCLNYQGNIRFIKSISQNTLGIYFIHGLIIQLTRPKIQTISALCNLPDNLIYAFAIMCICLIICVMLKKIPGIRKLV